MPIATQNPKRFRTLGDQEIKEFEFKSESWEEGDDKSGNVEPMSPLDLARYAKQIRFINKNKDARILVCAVAQEDTTLLYNLQADVNAQVANIGGAGMNFAWEHVRGEAIPSTPIRCLLEAGNDPKNLPERSRRTDVPKGAEGVWYVWYAEVEGTWKFAGQGFAQKKRNVVFEGVGEAKAAAAQTA